MPLSQDQRQGKLTTPLGENALALMQFSAIEGLSELFEIRIEAVSTQGGLDFASALGIGSTITLNDPGRQEAVLPRRDDGGALGRNPGGSLHLPARAEAVALAAHADLGLQDLRAEVADRHHQAGLLRPRLLRFPRRDDRLAADARILRPVPRDGFQFRLPADGGIRRSIISSSMPTASTRWCWRTPSRVISRSPVFRRCPTTRSTTPDGEKSNISRPGRSGAGRRAASSFWKTTATRNRPPTCSRRRRTPAATPTIRWRCSTTPTATSTRRATISSTRDVGEKFAKYKLEAAQSLDKRRSSMGAAPSLFPGGLITLERHPEGGENREYLITHCTHDFEAADLPLGRRRRTRLRRQLRDDAERPPVPRPARHP